MAAAVWGLHWRELRVLFRSDNMAVVEILRKRTSADPHIMPLLRCFVFYAAVYHFTFTAEHIAGTHNTAADAISRNNLTLFTSLVPQVQQPPVPQAVLDLLVEQRPDWGSSTWTNLFATSLPREFQTPPGLSTAQVGAGTSPSAASSA